MPATGSRGASSFPRTRWPWWTSNRAGARSPFARGTRSANRTATFLREQLGVARGERVAVLAKNSVAYLDLWFALGKLGAILQTLNWRLTASELAELLADATPRVLLYGPEFVEAVRALQGSGSSVQQWVALDEATLAAPSDHRFHERERYPDEPPPAVRTLAGRPVGHLLHRRHDRRGERGHPDARQRAVELGQHGGELGADGRTT